jgi:hypothetical protein
LDDLIILCCCNSSQQQQQHLMGCLLALSSVMMDMMSFPFFSSLTSSELSDYCFNVIDWFG